MGGNTPATDLDELLQHSGWIRNLAYASLRDHALAEDVTQEVLIKALAAPRRSGRLLGAWLKAVTVNTARNELRTRGRRQAREEKVARAEGVEQERDQDDVIAAYRKLTIALEDLAPQSRRIVSLRFFKGLSFREIGERLEIPESHARVRLHRALKELRSVMERRHQNWRAECLLLAPAAGFPKPTLISAGTSQWLGWTAGIGLVGAFVWWGVAANPAEEVVLESSVIAQLEEESTREVSANLSTEIQRANANMSTQTEAPPTPVPARVKRVGRVFSDGIPVVGAEIKVWQVEGASTTTTNGQGDFEVLIHHESTANASFLANGRATMVFLRPWETAPLLVDLPEPLQEGEQVLVREGKDPIAGAKVEVFVDWSGDRMGAYARASALEWVSEGTTDSEGLYFAPGWLKEMNVLLKVSADGFLPKATSNPYVNLARGKQLPVQLVYTNGEPVAGIPVRQGFRVQLLEKTDANGFLPPIDDWRGTEDLQKISYMPGSTSLHLPDGRIWHLDYDHYTDGMIEVLPDRIRITVDTAQVEVELVDFAIPEGQWVEARSLDLSYPALLPEDPSAVWQRLQIDQPTKLVGGLIGNALKSGMVGEPILVRARLMPSATSLGDFGVKNGKAVINPKPLCHFHFTLKGKSVVPGSDFVVILDRFLSSPFEMAFVDGVADGYFPTWPGSSYEARIVQRPGRTPMPIVGAESLRWPEINLPKESGGEVRFDFQELEYETQDVQIRVNGMPVVGGTFGRSTIGLDGVGVFALDEKGELRLDHLTLRLPVGLHNQPGGPILTSFNLGRKFTDLPGILTKTQSGPWHWDFHLALVELMTPAGEEGRYRKSQLSESLSGLNTHKNWPPYLRSWDDEAEMNAPIEGGVLAFRVPAGRYSFGIKGEKFGGTEGVELLAGQITVLEPDPKE